MGCRALDGVVLAVFVDLALQLFLRRALKLHQRHVILVAVVAPSVVGVLRTVATRVLSRAVQRRALSPFALPADLPSPVLALLFLGVHVGQRLVFGIPLFAVGFLAFLVLSCPVLLPHVGGHKFGTLAKPTPFRAWYLHLVFALALEPRPRFGQPLPWRPALLLAFLLARLLVLLVAQPSKKALKPLVQELILRSSPKNGFSTLLCWKSHF